MPNFDEWFKRATGNNPFPYQRRFAEKSEMPELVAAPTGSGQDSEGAISQSRIGAGDGVKAASNGSRDR